MIRRLLALMLALALAGKRVGPEALRPFYTLLTVYETLREGKVLRKAER